MNPEAAQKFYSDKLSLYHRFVGFLCYRQGLESTLRRLEYLKDGSRVLDAGCGSGTVTRGLYKIGSDAGFHDLTFNAFDITGAMLSRFHEWIGSVGAENIETKQANVLETDLLPGHWDQYDLIVSSGMLEYLTRHELVRVLGQLRKRLAKKGGMVVFISRRNLLMKLLMERWWRANTYSRSELSAIFQEAGFERVGFENFSGAYGYLNVWGIIVEAR